jgi:hypothetical protein
MAVYPDAQVEETERGLMLHPSRPPVAGKGARLTLVASRALPKPTSA